MGAWRAAGPDHLDPLDLARLQPVARRTTNILEAAISAMDGEVDELVLSQRLEALRSEHRALDDEVRALTMCGVVDQLKIMRLKRRKLSLKDEIFRLEDILNPDIIA
ncbi:YdcH family protein [Hyphomonadaceae bacterium BL14]|nr:YdcH family protein [Hyphomonadaceae bacterium BL14]